MTSFKNVIEKYGFEVPRDMEFFIKGISEFKDGKLDRQKTAKANFSAVFDSIKREAFYGKIAHSVKIQDSKKFLVNTGYLTQEECDEEVQQLIQGASVTLDREGNFSNERERGKGEKFEKRKKIINEVPIKKMAKEITALMYQNELEKFENKIKNATKKDKKMTDVLEEWGLAFDYWDGVNFLNGSFQEKRLKPLSFVTAGERKIVVDNPEIFNRRFGYEEAIGKEKAKLVKGFELWPAGLRSIEVSYVGTLEDIFAFDSKKELESVNLKQIEIEEIKEQFCPEYDLMNVFSNREAEKALDKKVDKHYDEILENKQKEQALLDFIFEMEVASCDVIITSMQEMIDWCLKEEG